MEPLTIHEPGISRIGALPAQHLHGPDCRTGRGSIRPAADYRPCALCAGTRDGSIRRLPAAHSVWPVYPVLLVVGAAQAFASPALSAMLPHLVSADEFPRAVAAASTVFQICTLAGPAVGGLIYALSGQGMFGFCALLYLVAAWQTPPPTGPTPPIQREGR